MFVHSPYILSCRGGAKLMLYKLYRVFKCAQNWVSVRDGSRTVRGNKFQCWTGNGETSLSISCTLLVELQHFW